MKYVESLNLALHELMGKDHTVYLIGEDLLDPYGGAFKATLGLSDRCPGRVISTPISEAAFTGAAIGLAIIVVYYRNTSNIDVETIHSLKG